MKLSLRLVGALVVASSTSSASAKKNMNDGVYYIANSETYDSVYKSEYFDVYSPPIRSKYSEVFWTGMDPVPIPQNIVDRFRNQTMAIVGYEVDQVRVDSATGKEVPVPITHAYNHHYVATMHNSKKGRVVQKKLSQEELDAMEPHHRATMMSHGSDHFVTFEYHNQDDEAYESGAATSPITVFSEANGGEMRLSYHGYPHGYAQLIHSPDTFRVTPMQIDTWNRDYGETPQFHTGPLPQISPVHGDETAIYSGLLECPCSTRRKKIVERNYKLLGQGEECPADQKSVQNATECWAGAQLVAPTSSRVQHNTGDKSKPLGCSLEQREDGVLQVTWNEPNDNDLDEIHATSKSVVAFGTNAINATVTLHETQATLTLVGPVDKWFGMGFGSKNMCRHMEADECVDGGPYAIIVYNDTYVEERYLDFHGKGKVLPVTLQVVSNTVQGGNRTVVLTRPLQGPDERYFSFDAAVPKLDVIMARGCNDTFAQHCGHGTTTLQFMTVDTPMRVCRDGVRGEIDGRGFNEHRCAKFPTGVLLDQGNPTCSIETYVGGLSCCIHGHSLLDKDQEIPWADQILEYRMKFRFYFEDYTPAATTNDMPSHLQMARFYWQTEASAGEYDITPCPPGTPSSQCVQVITSQWKVQALLQDTKWSNMWGTGPNSTKAEGIELINAMPHCHAPSCLSMELYNADTGQLLCHVQPKPGKSTNKVYDELGYLAIPPCLWSHNPDDGLMEPPFLSTDTNLLSIKRNNNTVGHFGEMASWQMRGVVVMHREDSQKKRAQVVNAAAKKAQGNEKAADGARTSVRKGRPEV
ncbi:Stress up-regulated Nod 19 [Seminavis robusta]|uniref:Stress up-regulated Nod 19 n=1 Tax=Seminavis robusta TaxID=568900 RepID=A0A9N8DMR8_9STRA|nr:Stress up-regulated Nod 19 [Seminavis robusta]|eukprot:Sro230_g093360.1 Stress up-regulated Nod 19 (809) ;mRNA; r:50095-52521